LDYGFGGAAFGALTISLDPRFSSAASQFGKATPSLLGTKFAISHIR
jgi:hypothetical protein